MKITDFAHHFCIMTFVIFAASACSPAGDFGRVHRPQSSIFDPRPGQDPQGNFHIIHTDEEKQMDRSIHRFVSSVEGESWLSAIRLTANALGGAYPKESDYFNWLRTQPFAVSSGRYAKLLSEVETDSNTLPAAYASICAVQETDRRRAIAARSLPSTDDETLNGLLQRRVENQQKVEKFVAVVEFRYDSYSYALEQLLVETPHDSARLVDSKLNLLAVQVQAASAGQFC